MSGANANQEKKATKNPTEKNTKAISKILERVRIGFESERGERTPCEVKVTAIGGRQVEANPKRLSVEMINDRSLPERRPAERWRTAAEKSLS